jgi:hypothetical protein
MLDFFPFLMTTFISCAMPLAKRTHTCEDHQRIWVSASDGRGLRGLLTLVPQKQSVAAGIAGICDCAVIGIGPKYKIGTVTPAKVLKLTDEELKACSFSRQQITLTSADLTSAVMSGAVEVEEV